MKTVKFQKKVLRFLYRKENKRYVELVDDKCFDTAELKLGHEVLRAYVKEFGAVPDVISAVEYLTRFALGKQMKPDVVTEMVGYVEGLFEAREEDSGLVVKSILDYAGTKRASELMKNSIGKMKDGGIAAVQAMHLELGKIAQLDQRTLELETNKGGFLLADHLRSINDIVPGRPCFLPKVNRMTAAGGFHTPQLVILLSAPKGFKTGLALNMAVEYVRDGLNVYYVDCENGYKSIKTRAQQVMMECARHELTESETLKTLRQVVKRMRLQGGDMVVDHYPAYNSTVADVEQNLRELYEEKAWRPDVIVWDYPDLMKPIVPQKEDNKAISRVYFDIINLNNRLGCFSIGVSQVNRAAVTKDVFTITDFAADFGKAMNCHSSWALCRTDKEVEAGVGRIVPVAQREGVRYKGRNVCFVRIDEEKMFMREIDPREAARLVEGLGATVKSTKRAKALTDD